MGEEKSDEQGGKREFIPSPLAAEPVNGDAQPISWTSNEQQARRSVKCR